MANGDGKTETDQAKLVRAVDAITTSMGTTGLNIDSYRFHYSRCSLFVFTTRAHKKAAETRYTDNIDACDKCVHAWRGPSNALPHPTAHNNKQKNNYRTCRSL